MRILFVLCAVVSLATAAEPAFITTRFVNGSGAENIVATAVDPAGNLIIAGTTTSTDLPGRTITRLTPETSLLRSRDTGLTWSRAASPEPGYLGCLAAHPKRSNVVLGCGASGIARSTDAGATWTTLPATPTAYKITHHPTNPDIFFAISQRGPLYRSTDAGINWQALSQPPGLSFLELSVDPFDPSVILLGAFPQFVRSTDGGLTWKDVLSKESEDSIVFDPHRPGRVYALAKFTAPSYALRVSTDHGATWTPLPAGPLGVLAADPHRADTLWIVTQTDVYRSQDAGRTFNRVARFSDFVGQLAVLPADPAVLVASTSSGIFKSVDDGRTWTLQHAGRFNAFLPLGDSELLASVVPAGDVYISKLSPDTRETLFTTYIGGSKLDQAFAMKVDSQGDILVAVGRSESDDFPSAPGSGTIVVFKTAATGDRLMYARRLGGLLGDDPVSLALDLEDNVYVAGSTRSTDWPVTTGARVPTPVSNLAEAARNGFVVKLDRSGHTVYSTVIGGSDSDRISAIAVDPSGAVWLTGSTQSANFPVTANALRGYSGGTDAFITQLSPSGAEIRYSTYFGGTGADAGGAVTLDAQGNLYVAGHSNSRDFPTSPGAFQSTLKARACASDGLSSGDGFVVRFNSNHSVEFATFAGATCRLSLNQIAVADGSVFLAGDASPGGLINSYPFWHDIDGTPNAFLARMKTDGSSLEIGPMLPGGLPGFAISLDRSRMYVGSGNRNSPYWPGAQAFLGLLDLNPLPNSLRVRSARSTFDRTGWSAAEVPTADMLVSPGALATIFVEGMDDIQPMDLGISPDSDLPEELQGIRVWFDGQPAPILSVEPGAIVCVVPSSLRPDQNPNPFLEIARNGARSNPRLSGISTSYYPRLLYAAPGDILVARNEDGTLNSDANPAPLGTVITIYASGLGPLAPPLPDGSVAPAELSRPSVKVEARAYNGPSLEVLDVSTMPGFVSSLQQINLRLPQSTWEDSSQLLLFISPNGYGSTRGKVSVRR
ncbi:MAG: SBBP repeat-containing protein [Bryobacterales bacterium]|nr:SBBP repeat-containing protein [Bryobacterales bacterium]